MKSDDRKLILIADDDPSTLRLVRTIVEGEGFIGVTASNGKEAYKLLKSGGNLGGAIVDIRMPFIEGTELVKFMRSDERFSSIPVLMMTGETNPQMASQSRSVGAIGFLPKPFSSSQLRLLLNLFR
jgi:two-component system chemotaxis response regulator CheY